MDKANYNKNVSSKILSIKYDDPINEAMKRSKINNRITGDWIDHSNHCDCCDCCENRVMDTSNHNHEIEKNREIGNSKKNTVQTNIRYPDLLATNTHLQYQTEAKSNFKVHKTLPSGRKFDP